MTTSRIPVRGRAATTVARVVVTLLAALLSYAVLLGDTRAAPDPAAAALRGDAPPSVAVAPWAEAYATLARRADAGCPQAARLALEMVRDGPVVYRMHFPHSAAQLRHWQRLAECRDPPCRAFG